MPEAGNGVAAIRTLTLRGEAIVLHRVAEAFDQDGVTLGAMRVLPITHRAWRVAGIDKTETRRRANLRGPHQLPVYAIQKRPLRRTTEPVARQMPSHASAPPRRRTIP